MSFFRCLFLLLFTGLFLPAITLAQTGDLTDCYRVNVDNLRVRSKPGTTNNEVLFSLAENTLVRYLGEKSDFTTKVTLRGKDYDEPWYKVETHGGQQGWLCGGAVTPFTGSGGDRKSQYEKFILTLNPADPNSVTRALEKYTSLFCPQYSAEAQAAFLEFRTFHSEVRDKMESNLPYEGNEAMELERYVYNHESNPDLQPPASIKKWVTPGEDNGFYLRGGPEGGVFWDREPDFLLDNFMACFDEPMLDFLTQVAMEEAGELLFQDASYGIDPLEAAERAVFWEAFMKNHPDFALLNDCKYNYFTYYSMLFCQLDNSPFFDYEKNQLHDWLKKDLEKIAATWPETQVGKDVKAFLELLKINGYKDTEEVKTFRKEKVRTVTDRDWCY